MKNKTAKDIALRFSEIFQNNYPQTPIWEMMVDLENEIEAHASLHCADKQREIEELKKLLNDCHLLMMKRNPISYPGTPFYEQMTQALNPSPVK